MLLPLVRIQDSPYSRHSLSGSQSMSTQTQQQQEENMENMEHPFNCPAASHPVHWLRHFMCHAQLTMGLRTSSAGMHKLSRALFWLIKEHGDPDCPGLHNAS